MGARYDALERYAAAGQLTGWALSHMPAEPFTLDDVRALRTRHADAPYAVAPGGVASLDGAAIWAAGEVRFYHPADYTAPQTVGAVAVIAPESPPLLLLALPLAEPLTTSRPGDAAVVSVRISAMRST